MGGTGRALVLLVYLQESFPEWFGRLGAAASTANLLDDVEGHACGEAGNGTFGSNVSVMGDTARRGLGCSKSGDHVLHGFSLPAFTRSLPKPWVLEDPAKPYCFQILPSHTQLNPDPHAIGPSRPGDF